VSLKITTKRAGGIKVKNKLLKAALALAVSSCVPFAVEANNGNHGTNSHQGPVLKVALWGDEFYNDDPDAKAGQIDRTIDSMNDHHLDFTLFAGDTKNGSSECSDQAIGQDVIDTFNRLNAPTLYSLGDNEWTDCHRSNNGSYDPLERLAYLRQTFFNKSTTQGDHHPIPVLRQGTLGGAYSENSRFVKSDVEFVALHIPGSNNNLVSSESLCTKKTGRAGRTWDGVKNVPTGECAAASDEYEARNTANLAWLRESFDEARNNNYAGIVIVIQADIYFPFELSDGGYEKDFLPSLDEKNGYTDFFNALVAEASTFGGQVLLVHGDSHYFKMDKAMLLNADGDPDTEESLMPNFTRVEVFGNADNSWILMTVDPRSDNVFSFDPVVLH
jgi:hypothetical protein